MWNLLPYLSQDKFGLLSKTPKKAKMEEKFFMPYPSLFSCSLNMQRDRQGAWIGGRTCTKHVVSGEAMGEVRKEGGSAGRSG